MFKQVIALVRSRSYDAADRFTDTNALAILRQQIRDSAHAVEMARKAVAVAIAQNRQEERQHQKILARIADLEARTISAMEQSKDDLAHEAAETIAILEAERDTSETAQKKCTIEIERLKKVVKHAEMRLRDLQRGQRVAAATEKTQKLRGVAPAVGLSTMRDAEETLKRLQRRQQEIDATNAAIDEMTHNDDPSAMSKKLAAAGCGAPIQSSAEQVLARLSAKTTKNPKDKKK